MAVNPASASTSGCRNFRVIRVTRSRWVAGCLELAAGSGGCAARLAWRGCWVPRDLGAWAVEDRHEALEDLQGRSLTGRYGVEVGGDDDGEVGRRVVAHEGHVAGDLSVVADEAGTEAGDTEAVSPYFWCRRIGRGRCCRAGSFASGHREARRPRVP